MFFTGDPQPSLRNTTHRGHGLAMFYPEYRGPADVTCVVDADDNVDTEVKRARTHGT